MIYLIHAVGTEFYKVGVANGPRYRLASLQTGCPMELTLLAVADWPDKDEVRIHNYLTSKGAHVRGEWFRDCKEIRDLLACMENGDFASWVAKTSKAAPARLRCILARMEANA